MPELPEVETIRRGLTERLSGQTLTDVRVRQAQLRHLVDVAALQEHAVGRTITSVDRRAKYLLVRLQPDHIVHERVRVPQSKRQSGGGRDEYPASHDQDQLAARPG